MTQLTADEQKQWELWYLNSYTLRQICNSEEKFAKLRLKTYKYVTFEGTIIKSNQFKTVIFPLVNGMQLTLSNVTFAPIYDSNIIWLGQLQEISISYHDHSEQMLLRQAGKIIGSAKRKRNLFILNTETPSRKMILIKDQDQLLYLWSKNSPIRPNYRRLRQTFNAKAVEVFILNDIINIIIEDNHTAKNLSFDLEKEDKDKCKDWRQPLIIHNKHDRPSQLTAMISNNNNHGKGEIKRLYDPYNECKYTKIIRYKKITLITQKL